MASRKEYFDRRNASRVYLLDSFPRWRAFKEENGIETDRDVANMLLDWYMARNLNVQCVMIRHETRKHLSFKCVSYIAIMYCIDKYLACFSDAEIQTDEASTLSSDKSVTPPTRSRNEQDFPLPGKILLLP
jgi:hypothetical protein